MNLDIFLLSSYRCTYLLLSLDIRSCDFTYFVVVDRTSEGVSTAFLLKHKTQKNNLSSHIKATTTVAKGI